MGIGQRIRKHRTMAMVRVREYRAARFSLRSSSSSSSCACVWGLAVVVVVASPPGISSRSTWAAAATSVSSTLRIASMVL